VRSVAAIDIGSNTTNLLVAGTDGRVVDRIIGTTRLGRGMVRGGAFDPVAVSATLEQLGRYREFIAEHDIKRWRAVATEAVRVAADAEHFLALAAGVLGREVELISGDEEGRLAHRGATTALPGSTGPVLVIDIGGGSTELAVGLGDDVQVASLEVGAVRLTSMELHGDPPRPEELTNAIGLVTDLLDDAVRRIPAIASADETVGVAGSIVTVAAVELGQPASDPGRLHGMRLTREAAEDVFRTLATEPLGDRMHNPGLPRERADIIVGGCCILVAIMRRLGLDELTVSTAGLLDGLVHEIHTDSEESR
jgi:exopolyphosphatase / guanosine-5'-triphosphate,3'-diphosphate pyrophosphatase